MANPGNNNNQAVRRYEDKFAELLPVVFATREYFGDFFNGLEALDGVEQNAKAFSIKVCDIPVVIGSYDTDADTAFGPGTGSSSRFGERTEIIYEDLDVPYSWDWTFHEGLDRRTVNNKMDAAVANRLDLIAQAKMAKFNAQHSLFISNVAAKTFSLDEITEASITALFNDADEYFTDSKAVGRRKAKVTSKIWNTIIDSKLAVKEKNSSVNIDKNYFAEFKDFYVEKLPKDAFQENECVYFYIENVGKAFTGVVTARTIESEDFDGVALQGEGLAGEFILEDNKPAVAKAAMTVEPTPSSEKKILSFKIGDVVGDIDESDHTVTAEVAHGTALTALEPTIEVSDEASVSPASGVATDFTNAVTYTVTAEDGTTQAYTVTVTAAAE